MYATTSALLVRVALERPPFPPLPLVLPDVEAELFPSSCSSAARASSSLRACPDDSQQSEASSTISNDQNQLLIDIIKIDHPDHNLQYKMFH